MCQSTVKEFFCVALLLCMIYYGQADYFSVQPPRVVEAEADQPVTQLECQAKCLSLNSADRCTIKWFRWTDTGIVELLADSSSCHRIPYSKWIQRKKINFVTVAVRSKLIINKFNPAYSGRYYCSLKTSRKVITSNNITLKAANASLPIVIPQQNCCLPSIQNIKARLLHLKENESMCVNVSWNEVPGDCQIMQWKLDMLEWDGIPSYDFADDGNKTNHFVVVNTSWRKICGLTTTKYYQFQLSTTVKPHNTSLKFGSHTYFFGNSSPAKIVDVQSHYEVFEGDDLVITCQATGMPTPDVQLFQVELLSLYQNSDTKRVQRSESTTVVTKRKVIQSVKQSDGGRYLCIASNTYVNQPQGIRNSTALALINVTVLKRTETSNH